MVALYRSYHIYRSHHIVNVYPSARAVAVLRLLAGEGTGCCCTAAVTPLTCARLVAAPPAGVQGASLPGEVVSAAVALLRPLAAQLSSLQYLDMALALQHKDVAALHDALHR